MQEIQENARTGLYACQELILTLPQFSTPEVAIPVPFCYTATQFAIHRKRSFPMVDTLERLSDHLYRFHDTCDVYVIVFENRALCIDFGAGDVLKELRALGVSRLDWVLHTHHHRDQCQGDNLARKHGARLAVPRYERFLFDEAENFWRNRRLYDVYNVRNTYFTLTQNIPVDADLADYEKFSWNGIEFTILPTPDIRTAQLALSRRSTANGSRSPGI